MSGTGEIGDSTAVGEAFELFWANSETTAATAEGLGRRIGSYSPAQAERVFTYPTADFFLTRPRDRLARIIGGRQSRRQFRPGTLSVFQLGGVLSGFAENERGTRGYPSAGGLYPLEIFCVANDVGGGLGGNIFCHNPDNHSLSLVGPAPPWPKWCASLNFPVAPPPQLVVVFVTFCERVVEKYGELGGRFLLIEVGHAAQTLALRVEQEGLAGCEIGAPIEDDLANVLGLAGTGGRVTLAYAVGLR